VDNALDASVATDGVHLRAHVGNLAALGITPVGMVTTRAEDLDSVLDSVGSIMAAMPAGTLVSKDAKLRCGSGVACAVK
jgi:hypothetical protein